MKDRLHIFNAVLTGYRAHPTSPNKMGIKDQWIKQQRREANPSTPFGAESKKGAIPPFHHTPSWRAQRLELVPTSILWLIKMHCITNKLPEYNTVVSKSA